MLTALNHIERKITHIYDWLMRRAFFLNSGQNYLIGRDTSAGCFFYKIHNIAIKTMASRFLVADNDVIEELKIYWLEYLRNGQH
jgi:hypothetical protein